jgi:hypothetical protein
LPLESLLIISSGSFSWILNSMISRNPGLGSCSTTLLTVGRSTVLFSAGSQVSPALLSLFTDGARRLWPNFDTELKAAGGR